MKSLSHAVRIGSASGVLVAVAAWIHGAHAQSAPIAAPASATVVLGTGDPERTPLRFAGSSPRPEAAHGSAPQRSSASPSALSFGADSPAPATETALAGATDPQAKLQVKGLTGTLNKVDVHQTMELRQRDFDRCIAEGQRSLRYVSGAMSFGLKVDGAGRIAEARTLSSTVGHRPLEQCLSATVASTQFPKPAGRATAVFNWGLRVDPATSRKFDTGNPKQLRSLARKQARSIFSTCEIKRRRARFKITAYVAAGGRLLSAGAVPQPQAADEKVDCVLEQVSKWHLPKLKRASKFTFDLR